MLPKLQYLLKQIHRFVAFYKVTVFYPFFKSNKKYLCASVCQQARIFIYKKKKKIINFTAHIRSPPIEYTFFSNIRNRNRSNGYEKN